MPNFCGSRPASSSNLAMSCLASEPRAPSAISVYLPRSSMPRVKRVLRLAVAADAHVAGGDPDHLAAFAVEHFGRGEAGIDLDAERLGLRAEPARQGAERADVIAVVVHQLRHRPVRQAHAARRAEQIEAVLGDLRRQRLLGVVAPVRQQAVEADRVDHRAGQDMGADRRSPFRRRRRCVRDRAASGGSPRRGRPDRRRRRRRRIPSPRGRAVRFRRP